MSDEEEEEKEPVKEKPKRQKSFKCVTHIDSNFECIDNHENLK